MRWACSTCCVVPSLRGGQMSLNAFLASAAVLKLDGVELAAEHLPTLRWEYLATLRQQIQENDLALAAVTWTLPPAPERVECETLAQALQIAHQLGAHALCLSGVSDWRPYAEKVAAIAGQAEAWGMPVALFWAHECGDPEGFLRLLDDLNSPFVGACLSIATDLAPTSPQWDAVAMVAPFAVHVHLRVVHLPTALVWCPAFELLRECEYAGFVSLVQVPEPPEEMLPVILSQLRRLV